MFNMAMKALKSVRAISSAHSWKNSVGMPSCPGALPLGKAWIASRISFSVRLLVRFAFISFVILVGTLSQHCS